MTLVDTDYCILDDGFCICSSFFVKSITSSRTASLSFSYKAFCTLWLFFCPCMKVIIISYIVKVKIVATLFLHVVYLHSPACHLELLLSPLDSLLFSSFLIAIVSTIPATSGYSLAHVSISSSDLGSFICFLVDCSVVLLDC